MRPLVDWRGGLSLISSRLSTESVLWSLRCLALLISRQGITRPLYILTHRSIRPLILNMVCTSGIELQWASRAPVLSFSVVWLIMFWRICHSHLWDIHRRRIAIWHYRRWVYRQYSQSPDTTPWGTGHCQPWEDRIRTRWSWICWPPHIEYRYVIHWDYKC